MKISSCQYQERWLSVEALTVQLLRLLEPVRSGDAIFLELKELTPPAKDIARRSNSVSRYNYIKPTAVKGKRACFTSGVLDTDNIGIYLHRIFHDIEPIVCAVFHCEIEL